MPPTPPTFPKEEAPIIAGEIDSVDGSIKAYLLAHAQHVSIVLLCTLSIEVVLFLLHVPFGILYVIPVLWPMIEYSTVRNKIQREFIEQFAMENGYTFTEIGTSGNSAYFEQGHDRHANDVVSGGYKGCPIKFYTYSYTVGSGKESHTYTSTVLSLEIDTDMPDLVLSSVKSGVVIPIPDFGVKLHTEGDFDKYFTLYVPKGKEIEALEVFAPDVMAILVDKAKTYTLEIYKKNLYIYAGYTMGSRKSLYAMFDLAKYFFDELGPTLVQMKPALLAGEAEAESRIKAN